MNDFDKLYEHIEEAGGMVELPDLDDICPDQCTDPNCICHGMIVSCVPNPWSTESNETEVSAEFYQAVKAKLSAIKGIEDRLLNERIEEARRNANTR